MARTKQQYENEIRTIVVGRVSSAFRKSKILSKILQAADSNNFRAFGNFAKPEQSNSISPNRDDRWLLDPDSVVVSVEMKDGLPVQTIIAVRIKLGLSEKYYYFSPKAGVKNWWPSGWETERGSGIINWVRRKMQNGTSFYWKDRHGNEVPVTNPYSKKVYSVAYIISRSIKKEGLKKRPNVFSPFDDAETLLEKAFISTQDRIAELYKIAMFENIEDIYVDFI